MLHARRRADRGLTTPSALLAALEEPVGDAVDPSDPVHQTGDPTDQRYRAEQTRCRDRGDDEHADRLVGVAIDQLTEPGHHRAARGRDHPCNVVLPPAPRLDQRLAHTPVMTWPRADGSTLGERAHAIASARSRRPLRTTRWRRA